MVENLQWQLALFAAMYKAKHNQNSYMNFLESNTCWNSTWSPLHTGRQACCLWVKIHIIGNSTCIILFADCRAYHHSSGGAPWTTQCYCQYLQFSYTRSKAQRQLQNCSYLTRQTNKQVTLKYELSSILCDCVLW